MQPGVNKSALSWWHVWISLRDFLRASHALKPGPVCVQNLPVSSSVVAGRLVKPDPSSRLVLCALCAAVNCALSAAVNCVKPLPGALCVFSPVPEFLLSVLWARQSQTCVQAGCDLIIFGHQRPSLRAARLRNTCTLFLYFSCGLVSEWISVDQSGGFPFSVSLESISSLP